MKNEWEENMDDLYEISKDLKDIEFKRDWPWGLRADAKTTTTPGIAGDPQKLYDWMHKEFGHCILGRWNFRYKNGEKWASVIRCGASFGMYEVYGSAMSDPERFETAEETLKKVREILL